MNTNHHITSWCRLAANKAWKNGSQLYSTDAENLADFLVRLYRERETDYPRFFKMDPLSKLGWLASELLLEDFEHRRYQPEETGLVFFNANASLDTDIRYWETVKDFPSPSVFVYTLPNIVSGEICIRNNFKGESAFFIAEQFDAKLATIYVNDLMDRQGLKACICGWIDVLGNAYNATLLLTEKNAEAGSQAFTETTVGAIFDPANNQYE